MIRRPAFGWRIALIAVTGFLAMCSVPIGFYFLIQGVERVAGMPQPAQLAALAHLVEQTPEDDREAVYAALHSPQLSLRVVHTAKVHADLTPLWPADEAQSRRYRNAMGSRDFAAYAVPRKLFARSVYSLLTAAEFRVALNGGGTLIVTSESAAWFTDFGMPIGFPVAVLGVVVGLLALILLNREFRPVLRLAKAVDALDPADPDARLPAIRAGTGEVRSLVQAFDQQQQRVAALLQARARMIGGIQHDVRTFATRLRLRLEKLPDADDRAQAETDIADLIALMDGALLATRNEAGALDLELIDMPNLLAAEIRGRQAEGACIVLTVHANAAGAEVLADRLAMRRIVANLVDNAERYGNEVHVSLWVDHAELVLQIDDDGPGIPLVQRKAMLEPFARMDPSRSRETGGAGLGLAIVKTLVESHEGTVTISDADMGGARIVVRLARFHSA